MARRHVLLITNDVVGERMAGPGIRFWEFARVLSRHFQVTLAVPPFLQIRDTPPEPEFPALVRICRQTAELRRLVAEADVILTLGAVVRVYPFLARTGKPLVVDAYDPFMLAGLEHFAAEPRDRRLALHENYRRAHLLALGAADFILSASERQRDYWLGMLSGLGRVNPYTHDDDPRLRRLIQVVPFGLPSVPPRHSRAVLKGVFPGIHPGDKVVLWGGGIWNWLDAPTALKAMRLVSGRRADVKLYFMGTERPNPLLARMSAVDEAMALARQLGLMDRYAFFGGWAPYGDRENYLLEADVGISLHRDVLEAHFAFRTRLLDCLWAGLPTVATQGDVLGEQFQRLGLGKLVASGDEQGTAAAILELVDTSDLKARCEPRFATVANAYRWEAVTEPLVAFCREPRLAPDKAYLRTVSSALAGGAWRPFMSGRAWRMLAAGVRNRLTSALKDYRSRWFG